MEPALIRMTREGDPDVMVRDEWRAEWEAQGWAVAVDPIDPGLGLPPAADDTAAPADPAAPVDPVDPPAPAPAVADPVAKPAAKAKG